MRAKNAWFRITLHNGDSLGKGEREPRVRIMVGFKMKIRVLTIIMRMR